jgi:hypothetical protein
MQVKRSIHSMPYKRRGEGVCAIERNEERTLWETIFDLLDRALVALPLNNNILQEVVGVIVGLKNRVDAIRNFVFLPHPPINKVVLYLLVVYICLFLIILLFINL